MRLLPMDIVAVLFSAAAHNASNPRGRGDQLNGILWHSHPSRTNWLCRAAVELEYNVHVGEWRNGEP